MRHTGRHIAQYTHPEGTGRAYSPVYTLRYTLRCTSHTLRYTLGCTSLPSWYTLGCTSLSPGIPQGAPLTPLGYTSGCTSHTLGIYPRCTSLTPGYIPRCTSLTPGYIPPVSLLGLKACSPTTRFTVGCWKGYSCPYHPFHCWVLKEPFCPYHPFHCWVLKEPSRPTTRFTVGVKREGEPWGEESLPGYVREVSTRVYMPPYCALLGSLPPYTARMYTVRTTSKVFSRPGVNSSFRDIKEGSLCHKERCFFSLRINLPGSQELAQNGQETRHRKQVCTRTSGIS